MKQHVESMTQLPSLKREKIEKLQRSKNRKYEIMADRIHQKHRSIIEARSAAYDKENDSFWNEWHAGFELASAWNKESQDLRSRYQQRVKERSDHVYSRGDKKQTIK
ncbi:MAG: hypothetical protein JST59_03000 [Actinobacteria bacterium]|nr:hypothetical protein [Actinomycetota bacterium]